MLVAARISAAIEILDRALVGVPLEQALTNWGRANRFAGSGDRAAIRDLVFDAWRCKRSFAALGGAETGRGLMLGRLRSGGDDGAQFFTGIGHAPAALSDADAGYSPSDLAALDCPDWLAPRLQASLGPQFGTVMQALQRRAPVFLRVNLARATRKDAMALLATDGIETQPHPLAESALEVLGSSRKLLQTKAYLGGIVELQDVSSQAVVEQIPVMPGQKVLDFCAGGGGKTLALAARADIRIWAHDGNPVRMRDLPDRAKRAGAKISLLDDPAAQAPYDLVLVDAPCSGSGSWRRDPQGKWTLSETRLAELMALQANILDLAAPLVAQGGVLAYATCSVLEDENQGQIAALLQRSSYLRQGLTRQFQPMDGGDGFFLSVLTRLS